MFELLITKKNGYFNKKYSVQIKATWNELNEDQHFEKLIALCEIVSYYKLEEHGLYGKQLDFKLAVVKDL